MSFKDESSSNKRSGSYSFVQVDEPQKRTPRSRKYKDVVYTIFQECMEYTDDSFWRNKLDDASRGILPAGCCMKGNYLTYFAKQGKKKDEAKISKNPEKALITFKKFMGVNFGKKSDLDVAIANLSVNNCITSSKMGKVEKKELFTKQIADYVNTHVRENELTLHQKVQMRATINYGICIGVFNEKSLIFDDDNEEKVVGIRGLISDTQNCEHPYIEPKIREKKEKVIEKKHIIDDCCDKVHEAYNPKPYRSKPKGIVSYAAMVESFNRLDMYENEDW